jgi:hypothetical protein
VAKKKNATLLRLSRSYRPSALPSKRNEAADLDSVNDFLDGADNRESSSRKNSPVKPLQNTSSEADDLNSSFLEQLAELDVAEENKEPDGIVGKLLKRNRALEAVQKELVAQFVDDQEEKTFLKQQLVKCAQRKLFCYHFQHCHC